MDEGARIERTIIRVGLSMSKSSHTQRLAQLRWYQVLKEVKPKFEDATGRYLMEQLKKVKFTKQGEIRKNKLGYLALDEFPSLVRMWEEKQNATT